jgi:lycopene beta-cyclase
MPVSEHYDFIICGGGMSGLSLAWHLNRSSLRNKKILIIEPDQKDKNDRTWAFWEKEPGPFEDLLAKTWDQLDFVNEKGQRRRLDIYPYRYKLLRGIDFYHHVLKEIKNNPSITWLKDIVEKIQDGSDKAIVTTAGGSVFSTAYAFDSTFRLSLNRPENHNLLQHFKGYVIETAEPAFDPAKPEMMNFSVPQINSECRFIYILPFSDRKALIEYTVFSEHLLHEKEYDEALLDYIDNSGIQSFNIIEQESGVIPMSDEPTEEFPGKRIVRIGTSGGYTNPSTGYTFRYTQKRLEEMVRALETHGNPYLRNRWFNKRFSLYASIILNVLKRKRHAAGDVFDRLYGQNKASVIFSFLDGETGFGQEIRIMNSTPVFKFMAAAFEVLKLRLSWRKK